MYSFVYISFASCTLALELNIIEIILMFPYQIFLELFLDGHLEACVTERKHVFFVSCTNHHKSVVQVIDPITWEIEAIDQTNLSHGTI